MVVAKDVRRQVYASGDATSAHRPSKGQHQSHGGRRPRAQRKKADLKSDWCSATLNYVRHVDMCHPSFCVANEDEETQKLGTFTFCGGAACAQTPNTLNWSQYDHNVSDMRAIHSHIEPEAWFEQVGLSSSYEPSGCLRRPRKHVDEWPQGQRFETLHHVLQVTPSQLGFGYCRSGQQKTIGMVHESTY